MKLAAAAGALPLVHIRSAHAAGKLLVGFWDHWVPAGNGAMRKLVDQWAEQNKVEVTIDFITSVGNKNLLTLAAESQSRTGHDIQAFPTWEVQNHGEMLEPMDDVVGRLAEKYGKIDPICEYLAKVGGHWRAMPAISGSQYKPPCARISVMNKAGFDVQAMYPTGAPPSAAAAQWTWDNFLIAAQKAQAQGMPFALGLGQTSDSVDWVGSVFAAHGAHLVDAKGTVNTSTDAVHKAMEYMVKIAKFLPDDVYSYDDASNNRALIANKSALIFNPPSAWAVAKKDAPDVAADSWTFPAPSGPAGRFVPYFPYFWGTWTFAKNKSAAKELIGWLSEREQAQQLVTATDGYDIPPFESMSDFKVWAEEKPPLGTVYNYPSRPGHHALSSIAAQPAPPDVAVQIYNQATLCNMVARVTRGGQSIEQAMAWAQSEVEGYSR